MFVLNGTCITFLCIFKVSICSLYLLYFEIQVGACNLVKMQPVLILIIIPREKFLSQTTEKKEKDDAMTVWLNDAQLIQRSMSKIYKFNLDVFHNFIYRMSHSAALFLPSSVRCTISNIMPLCGLLDICFSPNADENRPPCVCSSCTLSLVPQGSFWRRQTGALLMVQGTV